MSAKAHALKGEFESLLGLMAPSDVAGTTSTSRVFLKLVAQAAVDVRPTFGEHAGALTLCAAFEGGPDDASPELLALARAQPGQARRDRVPRRERSE